MKTLLFLMSITLSIHASAAMGGGFLFTTFRDEATPMSEQIYMAISEDGRQWKALKDGNPVLVSDVGEKGVRDSFLLRSHDEKKVWLIATDLCVNRNRDWHRNTHAGSRSIVVWESSDLVHWSTPRLALVAPEDAGCAWAPEAIYDEEGGNYVVYWASTTKRDNFSKQRIWATRTRDFRTFDKPFVFVEKPNHVIDINIIRDGDTYYRFTKDDKEKSVSMASSKRLMGPWQEMKQFTVGKGKNYEGPICFQLKAATGGRPPEWCLLLDNVSDRIGSGAFGYMSFISHDLSTGQFARATDFRFPYPFRHGSVLPITTAELERLKSAYLDSQKSATPASRYRNEEIRSPTRFLIQIEPHRPQPEWSRQWLVPIPVSGSPTGRNAMPKPACSIQDGARETSRLGQSPGSITCLNQDDYKRTEAHCVAGASIDGELPPRGFEPLSPG